MPETYRSKEEMLKEAVDDLLKSISGWAFNDDYAELTVDKKAFEHYGIVSGLTAKRGGSYEHVALEQENVG